MIVLSMYVIHMKDFQQNINSVNYHQFDWLLIQLVFLGLTYIIFIQLMRNQKTWYLDAQGLLSIAHFFQHVEIRYKYVAIGGPSIDPKIIKSEIWIKLF